MSQQDDDAELELPALDVEEGAPDASIDDGELELELPDDQADPFDDEQASDLPLDLSGFIQGEQEPSVIGDDATGLEALPATLGLSIEESSPSLLGPDADQLGIGGEEVLGIAPIPLEEDDGGLEGLPDPLAEQMVDTDAFPELDGSDDDDDDLNEIDVGIAIQIEDKPG